MLRSLESFPITPPGPLLPPRGTLVDEENSPFYDSKSSYPVKPEDIFTDRYQAFVPHEDGRVPFSLQRLDPNRELNGTVSFLLGEEKEEFLDLVKGMLVWSPSERKSAGELTEHHFLKPWN
ncbi:kinase-like domain-containing protein [Penicillium manginii]|uniref:kinase-like domain-containing protein n=1 Tax=Penicillium manginii TaxID=203109 RepID=UPI002546F362|nr:kinase-like domain-containing protein [Penicillium manginii]KAJ5754961.1 kinase-like domain-containing protein [Penicillium manginii]